MAKIFGPYSAVRKAGSYYFISGQVGVDKDKKTVGDVVAQTHQALRNLDDVLASEGLGFNDVVKTTLFLTEMSDFTTVNEVYLKYFAVPRPARSCVGVAELPDVGDKNLLIEIEAVAYKDEIA